MATEQTTQEKSKNNGQQKGKQPRVITSPGDVAGLVMMQIDAVNSKKDDLTIAIKGLADTAKATGACLRPATSGD